LWLTQLHGFHEKTASFSYPFTTPKKRLDLNLKNEEEWKEI